MPRFFVSPNQINGARAIIEGSDVNHIAKVLRMKIGEELTISDGTGYDYFCTISKLDNDAVFLDIQNKWESFSELPVKVTLFQGLPKADKMELIIQKTVELGVHEIVPVAMSRSIVKLDDKKASKKVERWQSISESAAKQAGRGIIPKVTEPMTYAKALEYAKEMDSILVPYENAEGISYTKEIIGGLKDCRRVAIFIGPEGGFAESEIEKATEAGAKIITLGKRILRTETAGLAAMSIMMFELEQD